MAGRKQIPNRVRFDCMVDKDLLAAARAKKKPTESWPELVARMLRFVEGGVSTQDLATGLQIALDKLEEELREHYENTKSFKDRMRELKPLRELVRAAKWLEHNRL